MLYIIYYDDDTGYFGYFKNYSKAVDFAKKHKKGCNFEIYEYNSKEDKIIKR